MTIPATNLVDILPSVLSAGGSSLALNGLMLDSGTRVPIGTVASFPTQAAVAAYFGAASLNATLASVYFGGFIGATKVPGAMLFVQYPQTAVSAFLRGGSIAALSLAQLQALNGSLTVVVDGYTRGPASINLSAATSFSSAAGTIQPALNAGLATLATITTGSIGGTTLTVTTLSSGTISAGQTLLGTGVSANTVIVSQLTGSLGGTGTYQVSVSQTAGSEAMTTQASPVSVVYDQTSGGILITSGATGLASTIGFGTGSMSISLNLIQTLGAVTSQGAAAASPISFMTSVLSLSQNWALFTTNFAPDAVVGTNTNKLLFSQWTSQQNNRYAYVPTDTDTTPQVNFNAPTSLGAQVIAAGYSGTCPVWEIAGAHTAAFVLGLAASIDFTAANGRTDFDFKYQSGLMVSVTDPISQANLDNNGYSFIAAWATATGSFTGLTPGSVSGPFLWMDSYVNQIWLNALFQQALMTYLFTVKSTPYNQAGYTAIENVLATPIQQGLNFGAYVTGVVLSSSQILEVNAAAGRNIAPTLQQQGWYLSVTDPGPSVRAVRGSPICNFFYVDGQSVQMITLSSVNVQ